jgi:hypothetical protein
MAMRKQQARFAPRFAWEPMRRGTAFKPVPQELVALFMEAFKCDREAALKRIDDAHPEIWTNSTYQVAVHRDPDDSVQLCIRRRDGGPILRDWRHFQAIKNDILGAECEAVELYPAESRLVDTANKFHLWGCADPTFRFAFGWKARDVDYAGGKIPGLRQRPF